MGPQTTAAGLIYDPGVAEEAEKHEKAMTFWGAVREDRRLIAWSLAFSGCIIMEGYGMAVITYLFSNGPFKYWFGSTMARDDGGPPLSEASLNIPWCRPQVEILTFLIAPSFLALCARCNHATWTTGRRDGGRPSRHPFWLQSHHAHRSCFQPRLHLPNILCPIWVPGQSDSRCRHLSAVHSVGYLSSRQSRLRLRDQRSPTAGPSNYLEQSLLACHPTLIQLSRSCVVTDSRCRVIGQLLAAGVAKGFDSVQGDTSWRIPIAIQWGFAAVLFAAMLFAPESPYWYLRNGKEVLARRIVTRLLGNGSNERVDEKTSVMLATIHQEEKHVQVVPRNESEPSGWLGQKMWGRKLILWLRACRRWFRFDVFIGTDRRRTFTTCVAWLIQSMCGSSLTGWAPKLLEGAGMKTSDAYTINVSLPALGVVGTVCAWVLMQRVGRRRIYLWGLAAQTVILAACGGVGFITADWSGWLAGAILGLFTLVYDLTVGPVCYSIVSEIPSIRLRTATISLARALYITGSVFNHVMTPMFLHPQQLNWGPKTAFLYAGICLLGVIYTWFSIPETKGLTPRDVDILFENAVSARSFSAAKVMELADKTTLADGRQ